MDSKKWSRQYILLFCKAFALELFDAIGFYTVSAWIIAMVFKAVVAFMELDIKKIFYALISSAEWS